MVPVFAIFWPELLWYHMAAAALYLVNYDFSHPWFLGHLWSLSVQEQFYFLWPGVLRKWHQHRVWIAVGAIAVATLFRVACHFLGLHGRADETFPAVADILAIGCLLAFFSKRMPKIKAGGAALMVLPVVLVPFYMGLLRFHLTVIVLFVLWPVMHFSIAGLLLHVVQRPYWILNFRTCRVAGEDQLRTLSVAAIVCVWGASEAVDFPLLAVVAASASYYLVEQPMIRMRERWAQQRKVVTLAAAA